MSNLHNLIRSSTEKVSKPVILYSVSILAFSFSHKFELIQEVCNVLYSHDIVYLFTAT